MAEGSQRMVVRAGVSADVIYDGLEMLQRLPGPRGTGKPEGLIQAGKSAVRYLLHSAPALRRFLRRVRACDVIVVVDTIPRAFLREPLHVEALRREIPDTPIVLYDVFYLGTRGPWARWIRNGNPEKWLPPGGYGLERFDWYLTASVVSEAALSREPQPSVIGLTLDDGSLRAEPKEVFTALLDFEHPPRMKERAVQVLACQETNTPFEVLNGSYTIEEIRGVYRRSSVFFLSMRESFGLPICEVQACGAYVFTPYSNWQPSHWIKADPHLRAGALSRNFVVYNNEKELAGAPSNPRNLRSAGGRKDVPRDPPAVLSGR